MASTKWRRTAFGPAVRFYDEHPITWDGTPYTYEVTHDEGGATYDPWTVRLNGMFKNQFNGLGQGGCRGQAGLEVSDYSYPNPPDSRVESDPFHLMPLKRRDVSGGPWITGWTGHQYIHWPCGTSPSCFNGVYVGDFTHWSDSKP
jgi:hypothetical protein